MTVNDNSDPIEELRDGPADETAETLPFSWQAWIKLVLVDGNTHAGSSESLEPLGVEAGYLMVLLPNGTTRTRVTIRIHNGYSSVDLMLPEDVARVAAQIVLALHIVETGDLDIDLYVALRYDLTRVLADLLGGRQIESVTMALSSIYCEWDSLKKKFLWS